MELTRSGWRRIMFQWESQQLPNLLNLIDRFKPKVDETDRASNNGLFSFKIDLC